MIKTYFINMFFHNYFTYRSQITHLALIDIRAENKTHTYHGHSIDLIYGHT